LEKILRLQGAKTAPCFIFMGNKQKRQRLLGVAEGNIAIDVSK
jgi:hypothetical protein